MRHIDTEARQRLLTSAATLEYCESLDNQQLAEVLFDYIVVDLPVMSPEYVLLSTVVDRLRRQGDGLRARAMKTW